MDSLCDATGHRGVATSQRCSTLLPELNCIQLSNCGLFHRWSTHRHQSFRFINFQILIEWNYRDWMNQVFSFSLRCAIHDELSSVSSALMLNYCYLISSAFSFFLLFHSKGCAKRCRGLTTSVWTKVNRSVHKNRIDIEKRKRNQIGSKLQDFAHIKIFWDYIFESWFVWYSFLFGPLLNLMVNENESPRSEYCILIEIFLLLSDYLQISRRRFVLDRQVI